MCPHTPPCPAPSAPDREAAHTIVSHPEQGWSLLCNGVVIFEDTGELLPGGAFIAPHRPTDLAAFDRPVVEGAQPSSVSGAKIGPAPVTWDDRQSTAVRHDGQPCPSACST